MSKGITFGAIALATLFLFSPGAKTAGDGPGLASKYINDDGLADDSAVIFFDDFEGYTDYSELGTRYNDGVYHRVRIAKEKENVFAGRQALEFFSPRMQGELYNTVARKLEKTRHRLFVRYYSKYDADFDGWGSSHNGCSVSAGYYKNGQASPGVKADGKNKFLAAYEAWRRDESEEAPGLLNVYIYHPEQRDRWGDHFFPSGRVLPFSSLDNDFGKAFVERPDISPETGVWQCHEMMVKANNPGKRDGRITLWLDGKLIADFMNLRLRDVESLKIDRFALNMHIKNNANGKDTYKWYDNLVVAERYIGPRTVPPE